MNNRPQYTNEEKKLAESIISHIKRTALSEYPFLCKPLCMLKAEPDEETSSFCADYHKIYYDPGKVIELYRKNKHKLVENVVHMVLHALLLHPSMTAEQDKLFDAAADTSVFCMMKAADSLSCPAAVLDKLDKITELVGSTSASDIYTAACENPKIKTLILSVCSVLTMDEHSLWYRKNKQPDKSNGSQGTAHNIIILTDQEDNNKNPDVKCGAAAIIVPTGADAEEWGRLICECRDQAKCSATYGSSHGNLLAEIKKPDRFSKFSYKEYLRRFASEEIICEDPETIDMIMYTWGTENLSDIPIVEFSETKEHCVVSDIIIAIDMSGSCSGEIAVNFLRQLYTLFVQMDIRSSVNIRVVTFDTNITNEFYIRSAKSAEKLINEYEAKGWGGTDFNCVFNYADNYSRNNRGKKLKGLFFFSDSFGAFPSSSPSYKTTFFVPVTELGFTPSFEHIPKWVDLVKYED